MTFVAVKEAAGVAGAAFGEAIDDDAPAVAEALVFAAAGEDDTNKGGAPCVGVALQLGTPPLLVADWTVLSVAATSGLIREAVVADPLEGLACECGCEGEWEWEWEERPMARPRRRIRAMVARAVRMSRVRRDLIPRADEEEG